MERMSKEDMDSKYCMIQASFDSPLPYELEVDHLRAREAEEEDMMLIKVFSGRILELEKENKELKEQIAMNERVNHKHVINYGF